MPARLSIRFPFRRLVVLAAAILAAAILASGCASWGRAKPNPLGLALARTAGKYIGVPYVYGGRSPRGFDCSGLTLYVFRQHGIKLPPTSRTQASAGAPVDRDELMPGDLVFFKSNKSGPVDHVGIYVGNGKFIHAPKTGRRVSRESLSIRHYRTHFYTARRVLAD